MGEYLQYTIKTDLPILQKNCSFLDMSRDETEKNNLPDLIDLSLFQSSSSDSLPVFSYMDNSLSYFMGAQIVLKSMNSSIIVGEMKMQRGWVWKGTTDLVNLKKSFRIGVIISPPWLFLFMKQKRELCQKSETWSGLIGLLIQGNVDMVVSDLSTTLERGEVIDFVTPPNTIYQNGYPVREQSLFKFMEVLKSEVWVSILGAFILTAFLLWFLEKYSPFSARNNLQKIQ
ncbi:GRIN [Lepeophtheirus salmonis]|uniref:GRIN n=1 Tax=Lepeophtheirus salmonis TaxID=72036 RepID=A0A817FBG5_LEPSM|nr:GRIN [Lepeophtheirus salmonis]CAG9477207.1 GRIN [Lepeophtheirus salmonis]